MVLHNKYMRVNQNGRNKLFGIDPWKEANSKAQVLQMLISQKGRLSHSKCANVKIFTR